MGLAIYSEIIAKLMQDYSETLAKNGRVIGSSYAYGLLVIPKSYENVDKHVSLYWGVFQYCLEIKFIKKSKTINNVN